MAMMKPATFGVGTMIGPQNWRNNTIKAIKLSQNIASRSDQANDMGRSLDPIPHLRETLSQLSNDEIKRYVRETRIVVARLKDSLLKTNEEIKSLSRGKEALEKALEHKRKDISLNNESVNVRVSRPKREKEHDGADDLLNAERMHLLNLKRMIESHLRLVKQQLQLMDSCRKRLAAVTQERSRVLDLTCHTLSAALQQEGYVDKEDELVIPGYGSPNRPSVPSANRVDALGPFTPECDYALNEATDSRKRALTLRKELKDLIDRTAKLQQAAHKSVNDGFTQKVAETTTLKQHLHVAAGENKHATHRAQRWYDATERARGYSLGPICYSDLRTHERLDRPQVRVYHRHPGTQLPEAQDIISGGDGLLESMTATSRNIGLLKLGQMRLQEDIRDKAKGREVDSSIFRLRRRKANHRWAMGAAF